MPQVAHTCHAPGCSEAVPPKIFMCRRHWYQLPKTYRDRIWLHYRPGQEIDKNPSEAYLEAARACKKFIADRRKYGMDRPPGIEPDLFASEG